MAQPPQLPNDDDRVLTETQLTITRAARQPLLINPDTGRPVDRSQVFRWIVEGRLTLDGERIYLGAKWHPVFSRLIVSKESIERFAARLRGADVDQQAAGKGHHSGQLRRARRELDRDTRTRRQESAKAAG